MKKAGILLIIVLLISGSILLYSGILDKLRVRGVIKGFERAMEGDDPEKMMSFVSLRYSDPYGFNYTMVKRLLSGLTKDFDNFDVILENPVIEMNEDTATVKFDAWVTVDWNGNPSYIVGSNQSAAHIRAFIAKEFLRWKVVRVEGVK